MSPASHHFTPHGGYFATVIASTAYAERATHSRGDMRFDLMPI